MTAIASDVEAVIFTLIVFRMIGLNMIADRLPFTDEAVDADAVVGFRIVTRADEGLACMKTKAAAMARQTPMASRVRTILFMGKFYFCRR